MEAFQHFSLDAVKEIKAKASCSVLLPESVGGVPEKAGGFRTSFGYC